MFSGSCSTMPCIFPCSIASINCGAGSKPTNFTLPSSCAPFSAPSMPTPFGSHTTKTPFT